MRIAIATVFAAGCLLAGCASLPGSAPHPAERLLDDLHARHLFQGAAVIGRHGRIEYQGAFGLADREANAPFGIDTPSDTGSIAKTFTATALLELVAEGRVDLEAPVQSYLADFPHAATKVRHLISHSAGLPGYGWFEKASPAGTVLTNAEFVRLLAAAATGPAFAPGSRFEYDNVAYDVAALVLERVTGARYENHLRARYFAPLRMQGAFVRPARLDSFRDIRTRGYRWSGSAWNAADALENEGFHGGGNIYLSASDLHRWAASHASGAVPSPRAASLAFAPARLDDGRASGLSWASWYLSPDGTRGYYVGDHEGFHAFCYWDRRRRIAIAFVSNGGMPAWLKPLLARALVAVAEGEMPEPAIDRSAVDYPVHAVTGPWQVPRIGRVIIRAQERRRFLAMPSGVEYPMFRVAPGIHYVPGLDAYVSFEGPSERADGVVWSSVFVNVRGARG